MISSAPRNATITALTDMRVHAITPHAFRTIVLSNLIVAATRPGPGILLNVGGESLYDAVPVVIGHARTYIARLDPTKTYFVAGGNIADRELCAFLLIQRGISAFPVVP